MVEGEMKRDASSRQTVDDGRPLATGGLYALNLRLITIIISPTNHDRISPNRPITRVIALVPIPKFDPPPINYSAFPSVIFVFSFRHEFSFFFLLHLFLLLSLSRRGDSRITTSVKFMHSQVLNIYTLQLLFNERSQ